MAAQLAPAILMLPPSLFGRTPQGLTLAATTRALVPAAAGSPLNSIDIRSAFSGFLTAYAQRVVIQRLNLTTHCPHCWNEVAGEGDPLCLWCLGRGYESSFRILLGRRMSALNEHREQLAVQSSPGAELEDEVFWFFPWDTNIQEEDIIFEVTWRDADATVVDHLLMSYWVTYADPFRAVNGRLEFWRASCLGRPIDKSITGRHLTQLLAQRLDAQLRDPMAATPNAGLASFHFVQSVAASSWIIVHLLGHRPSVITTDPTGGTLVGIITYPNLDTVVVTFSVPTLGMADLS